MTERLPPERIHIRYNAADVAEPFYAVNLEPWCNETYGEIDIFKFMKHLRSGKRGAVYSLVNCRPCGENEDETAFRLAIDAFEDPVVLLRNRGEPLFQDWYVPAPFLLEPYNNILKLPPRIYTDHDGDLYFDLA